MFGVARESFDACVRSVLFGQEDLEVFFGSFDVVAGSVYPFEDHIETSPSLLPPGAGSFKTGANWFDTFGNFVETFPGRFDRFRDLVDRFEDLVGPFPDWVDTFAESFA